MTQIRLFCGDCGGSGDSKTIIGRSFGIFPVYAPCSRCHGTGDSYPPIADQEKLREWLERYRKTRAKYREDDFGRLVRIEGFL